MISETKLDNSFPEGQLLISGYGVPYIIDRNCHGGGIILFVREDIPSKLLSTENALVGGFYIELNLGKKNGYFVVLIAHMGILLIVTWSSLTRSLALC